MKARISSISILSVALGLFVCIYSLYAIDCTYFVSNCTDHEFVATVTLVGGAHRTGTVPANFRDSITIAVPGDVCPGIASVTIGDVTCFAGHTCDLGGGVTIRVGTRGFRIRDASCD